MTLVELLIAIAIISILATVLLGVAATAGATAREARTKSLVARLHTLLIEQYDGYRNRRVELRPDITDNAAFRSYLFDNAGWVAPDDVISPADPRVMAMARVAGIRELMKLEMPDRWSDVYRHIDDGSVLQDPLKPIDFAAIPPWLFLDEAPTLWRLYAREYNRLVAAGVTRNDLVENQGAECLYLTIVYATGDGEARGLFKESDVGDTDGDSALEFLDGWGNPIEFLRWAPGFDSDAQESYDSLALLYNDTEGSDAEKELAVFTRLSGDHDPLDLFRVDQTNQAVFEYETDTREVTGVRAWRLAPLIVSAGVDEEFGLEFGVRPDLTSQTYDEQLVILADPYADDIFAESDEPNRQRLGDIRDPETYADNIDNHGVGDFVRAR